MSKECPHCQDIIEGKHAKYANHIRWCKKNPKYSIINFNENIKKGVNKKLNEKFGKYKTFSVNCFQCGKVLKVEEREKQFPKKEKYFCNRSCANIRKHSKETKRIF